MSYAAHHYSQLNYSLSPTDLFQSELDSTEAEEERLDGPKPLTAEHKRLLRFKSYSFPYLAEESWPGDEDEEDRFSEDGMKGDRMRGGYDRPETSNFLVGEEEEEEVIEDSFEIVDTKHMWTNLLYAPETSLTESTEEIL